MINLRRKAQSTVVLIAASFLLSVAPEVATPVFAQSPNPHAVSMYNLGLNAYKQGSPESAIIFFRRACDIDPNLADAQYNLGVLYQSQRRFNEAIPRFQEVLRVKTNDGDAHFQLGVCQMGLGNFAEAITEFNTIPPNNSHFAEAQQKVQECRQKIGGGGGPAALPVRTQPPVTSVPPVTQSVPDDTGLRQAPESVPAYQPPATQAYNPADNPAAVAQTPPQDVPPAAQNGAVGQPYGQTAQSPPDAAVTEQPMTSPPEDNYTPPGANKPTAVLANSSVRVIATGFHAPSGLTFDKFGNLYVANFNSNTVDRISRDGTRTQFSSGGHLKGPIGLVADDSANIYVANYAGGTIARITPAGISTVIATGFKQPYYLTLDKSGNLFVSQQKDNSIIRITLPQSTVATPTAVTTQSSVTP